ncbi:diguanylate cyclase [Hwanghaeella sp.]|uniref:GGDEF domain-containing protein n=1 Tax=Hwanghaeella sp. TaxID=2605943 RepID=UPI003CCBA625
MVRAGQPVENAWRAEGAKPSDDLFASYVFKLFVSGLLLSIAELSFSLDWLKSIPVWVLAVRIAMTLLLAGYCVALLGKGDFSRYAIWVAALFFILMQVTNQYSESLENIAIFTSVTLLAGATLATRMRDLHIFFAATFLAFLPTALFRFEPVIFIGLAILFAFAGFFGLIFFRYRTSLAVALSVLGKSVLQDRLTGVGNRRAYDEAVAALMENYRRNQMRFALLLIDIDHFKRVNDRFGHDVGDVVLTRVADCIRQCIRVSDLSFAHIEGLYRFGGEEFVVLLPGAGRSNACRAAERIRKQVETAAFFADEEQEQRIDVTISIGVATSRDGADVHNLFKDADQALYAAKNAGRNRVEAAADDLGMAA